MPDETDGVVTGDEDEAIRGGPRGLDGLLDKRMNQASQRGAPEQTR